MSGEGTTYADAGVDIKGEGNAIRALVSSLKFRRKGTGAQVDIGGNFTGLVEFGEHYLSMCTDGVGTKIMIAEKLQRWDTVGIDCMAMNVNDLICIGAEPIAFVDYIATEDPRPEVLSEVGKGLNEGARQSDLTIIGGETATIPEIVNGLDLAGTCLGFVKKDSVITGKTISPGDIMIALPSSGIHSNGFSLVRRVVRDNDLSYASPLEEVVESRQWKGKVKFPDLMERVRSWVSAESSLVLGEVLLTPTRIYVKEIMELLEKLPKGAVKGMANITGGGFRNLSRMKEDVRFIIDDPLPVPPVFDMIQILGGVETREMYQTFNMGMGFALILDKTYLEDALNVLDGSGAKKVGKVKEGSGVMIEPPRVEFKGYV
ncbi:MAG: phosphoribosylformylglycinamidine cyclo-ligase [Candidatus Thermoplasmatota archaeon]|nr:phosphoribosylformylglycinamidine cyclo-ligase [Candidatus Thermoplasmatota archaeon]